MWYVTNLPFDQLLLETPDVKMSTRAGADVTLYVRKPCSCNKLNTFEQKIYARLCIHSLSLIKFK